MALLQKAYLGPTKLFREKSWFEDMSAKPIDVSSAVTVTADVTAHTRGGWSPLIASTSANATYIVVEVTGVQTSGANTATLLTIGTGSVGSETAIIDSVAVGGARIAAADTLRFVFQVPFKIPSGTRLSAQIQSIVAGGKTATVQVWTFDMGDYNYAPTAVDVIGTNTATSDGTQMSGVAGSWTPIIASTANAYRGFVLIPSLSDSGVATVLVNYTLGKGPSGFEEEIGQAFGTYNLSEAVTQLQRWPLVMGGTAPAGTRLAVKHDIVSTPSDFDVCVIGIR